MATEKGGTTSTPVYVPYTTFVSALDSLKRDGIPGTGKIDKSLWDSQSGAIQGQLLLAFRFLGLIDEHNKVLPALPPLVAGSPDDRKPILRKIITEKYDKIVALDLNTITQGQLDEAMRSYGIGGSTLLRAVRFFVKACQETDIPISNRVATSSRTQNGTPAPRPARRRTNGNARRTDGDSAPPPAPPPAASTWEEQLLGKFPAFDPNWPDALKEKWFAGFDRLMGSKPA